MAMKIFNKILYITLALFFSVSYSMAQCAMCRVTVENNVSNGDTSIGAGLNMGILYLFITPYLLLTVLGILWYRHSHKKKRLPLGNRSF